MIKRLVPLCAVVLAGCTTFSNIDEGMTALVGQPIDAAVDKLGYPTNQVTVGGKKIYTWGRSYISSIPSLTTSNVNGTVNGRNYSGTVTTTGSQPVEMYCTLRFITDQNDVIVDYNWAGNLGGCGLYSRYLKVPKTPRPAVAPAPAPGPVTPRGKDNKDGV
ncbi:hypothetical protein QH494_27470 [Sphingomonas sp. AR_OL41]|uniref:hypothetical protein n=1 Tax=Sphingomonas sp. AR_OL41 TaxID=3042729 RepID=UPI00247FC610|nr:hypothetical protein [Sphingomonas sp. AR_OL41]MDH7975936.1 hypothetical protein [Sphingomonas sp. AR_OL41]